ncbi:hypothetical protein N7492_004436 [Penicillium capsulatum]|uniref:RING-type E3 ubiquitin transferase n=1 Tax=Penicillium capsulatum TaxID=69766 RepID=A0A9W9IA06_9EURO|nr:hypothetical protein N7492_004436 [Penicillium capsulatum]
MDLPASSSRAGEDWSAFPDVMNDPAFDERERGFDDLDTCRICHGEATEEEPLFSPCKCSGSIKFVHQNCLVEWLAHSQKKHCELCKTTFRFTKLYDPNMPQSLPTPLFLQQAMVQAFGTLVTWLRFVLVAFVWLGWLPWSMRAIWRALFWLADGRWSGSGAAQEQMRQSARGDAGTGNGTAIVNSMVSAASSTITTTSNAAASAQPSTAKFPSGDPLMLTLIKKIIPSLFVPALSGGVGQNGPNSTVTTNPPKPRYPSWLSDVKFLNNLTPYPTINNMIIDTLEGQLITLLVVVAFILLFLIREWVVQQQPMANIAEGEREAALQLIANANNQANDHAAVEPDDQAPFPANPEEGDAADADSDAPRSIAASPAPSWTDSDDGLPVYERPIGPHNALPDLNEPETTGVDYSGLSQALRDPGQYERSGVAAFQDVLTRANGDRDEMLRIIRDEGREQELGWVLNAFNGSRRNENPVNPFDTNPDTGGSGAAGARLAEGLGNQSSGGQGPPGAEPVASQNINQENVPAETLGEDEPPKGLSERLLNWFWGDIALAEGAADVVPEDDEHIVQDPALEDPFVPIQNRIDDPPANGAVADGAADAGMDGNDMDAIEGDDFDGIMDLIGMQGPIFGLLQNAVFCALLIAFTVAIGIWLPYLWGKIALVLLANPLELIVGVPMTAVTVVADIALDTLIGFVGYLMYWLSFMCRMLLGPLGTFVPAGEWVPQGKSITSASLSLIDASTNRLNKVVKAFLVFHDSDIPMFSVLSHQALRIHQARLSTVFQTAFAVMKFILYDFPLRLATLGVPGAMSLQVNTAQLKDVLGQAQEWIGNFTQSPLFSNAGSKLANMTAAKTASSSIPVDYDLVVWDSKDRFIAILMGYMLATALGFSYLRTKEFFTRANRGQRAEGIVAEVLLQAGGVMKVILIIGIEMIVFPLYCGTLLDLALLPLFSEATILSRITFTKASPLTSLFVHWFIGTCYMFHFALFVSMCRKILRSGVLYFIRDPDDPTFHPIRDVLERSITTQLRKIGFSALVYGALVIVCLGGVVWGLHFAFDGVLPIHWSASAPMLEFPVDLLFYNFVMPLAIQSVKPSDGLHDLYDWWFHRCAHFLRLSNFFFPERHPEEEGRHVRRSWWGVLLRSKGDWRHPVIGEANQAAAEKDNQDVYFLRDGRYVRAPASDQVRIPKGTRVFMEVTEHNERVDGKPDLDDGLHGRTSNMFTKVYVPPNFRSRIAAFILLIWLFAAFTGVSITVLPLVIGRAIILYCFASPVPVNDIYAFSSGLFVVGGLGYLGFCFRAALLAMRANSGTSLRNPQRARQFCASVALDAARLLYLGAALVVVLPSLFALLTELYILIPAHTLLGDGESHVIHVVQDWTLGVLYVQMAIKLTVWHPNSWAASIIDTIFRDGWLRPNIKLATRALVLPLLLLATAAAVMPLMFGGVVRWTVFYAAAEAQPFVYRYAYPATLLVILAAWTIHFVMRRIAIWRINIRDDVYLIGERLHNYSEKRARDVGMSRRVVTG